MDLVLKNTRTLAQGTEASGKLTMGLEFNEE